MKASKSMGRPSNYQQRSIVFGINDRIGNKYNPSETVGSNIFEKSINPV